MVLLTVMMVLFDPYSGTTECNNDTTRAVRTTDHDNGTA
jgi:hypothetical protein